MTLNYAGQGAPYPYDYISTANAITNPSTIHAEDVTLTRFFERYLLQRALSQFKWEMPDHWEQGYALYCLYCWGYFCVINTDKFGVIPQGCTLKGYNVMYGPRAVSIANPLLKTIKDPVIGKDTEIVRLQPDYGGIWDLVSYYAQMMSMTASAAGSNTIASKLAYVFGAKNKNTAESFKGMLDKILSGEPAVFVDKQLLDEDGKPTWHLFTTDLKSNYIAPELLEQLSAWERRFDTEVGIPHTNTEKKERLITGEINSNFYTSYTRVALWLDTLKKSCKKVNKMFGENTISVDWRVDPEGYVGIMEGEDDGKRRSNKPTGSV